MSNADLFIGPCLFPVEKASVWAERYGLSLEEAPCSQCGTYLKVLIPFATKNIRGLMAPICPTCGNTKVPFLFVEHESSRPEIRRIQGNSSPDPDFTPAS